MADKHLPPSGKVVGGPEKLMVWRAVEDLWFTEGRFTDEFEKRLAAFIGARHASFCNSGSSANLLAVLAMKEMYAIGDRDEVVTAACGFPTTLNPILQAGLKPVFVDIELGTYVPTLEAVQEAVTPRTAFVVLAHTLGNPAPVAELVDWSDRYSIGLVEDNCDALGSVLRGKRTGSFGHLATQSFYPAHHITTGEGGAVIINLGQRTKHIVESYRDWGRDCWCPPGKDNTCNQRFGWEFDGLPPGYDHKYVYTRIGYNLKATDMQAALGLAQMDRLEGFIEARRANFDLLLNALQDHSEQLILPQATEGSEPSWFGFPITIRDPRLDCRAFVQHLEGLGIGTRPLFGGSLVRQPAYRHVFGSDLHFPNSDRTTSGTFWVGVWPGLTSQDMERIAAGIRSACANPSR